MKRGDKVVWLDPAHETSHVTEIVRLTLASTYICSNGTTELEALEKEILTLEDVFCHKKCGCIDIQCEAWSHLHYIKGQNRHKEFIEGGKNYCPSCNETFEDVDELITVKEYLKNK